VDRIKLVWVKFGWSMAMAYLIRFTHVPSMEPQIKKKRHLAYVWPILEPNPADFSMGEVNLVQIWPLLGLPK
jgi:hypothetical protein